MAASITPLRASPADAWSASLARADDDTLVELLATRPELLDPVAPAGIRALVQAVLAPASCSIAIDRLDRSARQALEACCVLAEPVTTSRLAAALGCGAAEIGEVVARLEALWLVLAVEAGLLVNPGLRSALRHPARLGRPAATLLAQTGPKELAELARRLGEASSGGKAALLESIATALRDPAVLAGSLEGAPAGTAELARRFALRGPVVELGYSATSLERLGTDRTPTGWLLRRGLLVAVSWGMAEMPAEAAIALRGGVVYPGYSPRPPELDERAVDGAALDAAAARAALAVVADVAAVLGALSALPAKVLRDGGLGVREVRRLARACGRDETTTAHLVELAAVAGLAGVDPHERVALPTGDFDAFLDESLPQRWRRLAEAWLHSPIELSLAGGEDVDGKPIPPLLLRACDPGAAERREALAGVLAAVAPGRAASLRSLADLVDWRAASRSAAGGHGRVVGWQLAEAELLGLAAGLGAKPAGAGLGAKPAGAGGADRDERLATASSFGRLLLGGDGDKAVAALSAFAPRPVEEIVLQADLTAVAAGELPPVLRRDLELAAEVESSGAATVFRFGEVSLRRWFDAGRSSADLLATLERHARRGVPQSLAYLVEDLARRHGRVRVGAARSYVRAEDASLVAEVVGSRRLARAGMRALAPTVLVSDVEPDELVAQLRQAGYLAAPETSDGELALRRPPARRLETAAAPLLPAATAGRLAAPQGADRRQGLGEIVAHLRRSGRSPAPGAPPPSLPGSGAHGRGGAAPAWAPLGATPSTQSRPGRQARPTQIAKGPAAVRGVLELAMANDWAVRLCARDGESLSATREQYALPFALRRELVSLQLPDGEVDSLPLARILWARILTEAEEEAHDLVGRL